jgi:superfamily II DNA or RNA helicase
MRKLRQYQREAYNEIFAAWETDDILMYVLATGGGKTVIFVEIIRELLLRHKRPVLAAHRQELIHQSSKNIDGARDRLWYHHGVYPNAST